jgi:polyphosphate:AMP phosphotransferase
MEHAMARIAAQEQMLSEEGMLILKFWFHLSRRAQKRRFKELEDASHSRRVILSVDYKPSLHYGRFAAAAEAMIRGTDTGCAPWQLVEAADDRHRDLTTAQVLLAAMQERIAAAAKPQKAAAAKPALKEVRPSQATVLEQVDLSQSVQGKAYTRELEKLQGRLNRLAWKAHAQHKSCVLVFEGWDAAGKGSAIRRVTEAIDARLFRVVPIAAPTEEERAHHYLWRFWRHLPRAGMVTIFDRSWYGRVLVERVEGFASREAWSRAYHEINEFEKQLAEHGTVVLKFWIHISKDEQMARFKKRQEIEHKNYKITEEDWRNRKQWGAYEAAVHDMVTHTSTREAPWKLVAGNDKKFARLEILRTFCRALKRAL